MRSNSRCVVVSGKRPARAWFEPCGSIENHPAAWAQHAMRFTQRRGAWHEVDHIDRQDSVGELLGERQLGEIAPDKREASGLERQPIATRGLREHRLGPVEPDYPLKTRRTKQRLQRMARAATQFEQALAVAQAKCSHERSAFGLALAKAIALPANRPKSPDGLAQLRADAVPKSAERWSRAVALIEAAWLAAWP